jgi:hypothetical protein
VAALRRITVTKSRSGRTGSLLARMTSSGLMPCVGKVDIAIAEAFAVETATEKALPHDTEDTN